MIRNIILYIYTIPRLYVCLFVPLYSDTIDVLFDDGVEYTAPFRAVRRRVGNILISLAHNF